MTLPFRPKLLWVDMEMSGLNPRYNRILEFACIITDEKLQYQHEGPHIILHCDQEHLLTMDEWNTKHHTKSGLFYSCIQSTISIEQAQQYIINYLKELGVGKGELMIAGNSVHMDKLFLFHWMPKLDDFLHYRILDVTSIKTVVNAVNSSLFFPKKSTHRALDDIRESIGELNYYMKMAFK